MNVLITGINGFVGQALAGYVVERWGRVRGSVRCPNDKGSLQTKGVQVFPIGDIDEKTVWQEVLEGVDVVVHLAARVHLLRSGTNDLSNEFRRVNTFGTARLAEQAAKAGVKRFVYLSSIKVNGEETKGRTNTIGGNGKNSGERFSETDIPKPMDPYSLSKLEGEKTLQEISSKTGMELVIVRPPLVYGPGVRANFFRVMHCIEKGIPLPLGSVSNQRSMIYLGNLVDFIGVCISHPAAAGEIFCVADGEEISTPELIRRIAFKMSRSPCLLPCPVWLLRFVGRCLFKKKDIDRLCGSLQVDIDKARRVLSWQPLFSVEEGLKKTVDWYMDRF